MNINNSTILLTGATGGIGRAIAQELAKRGASLILVGRNEESLQTLQRELSNPERHYVVVADITSSEGLTAIKDRARQHQKVDALINNAGSNDFSLLSHKRPTQIADEI
ncbi:SDR family NAD(P)-dependent oxidoreductase, partial [Vibrio parahaemolyticus]|nr:SDR family NAD(P)-dependent oxidoreductase [Vibrio parahaemolyticus]